MDFITGHGDNITIFLLGTDDKCKCSVGNKIIQLDHFYPERSLYQEISLELQNCIVTVTNIQKWHFQSLRKIQERTNSSSEHPCMIVFVLQPDCVTQSDVDLLTKYQQHFGKDILENTTVLLYSDTNKRSAKADDKTSRNLQHIVYQCQRKVCEYNTNMEPNDLMKQLMKYWKTVPEYDR